MGRRKETNYFVSIGVSVLILLTLNPATEGGVGSNGKGRGGNKRVKKWIRDMNFDNPDNWDGLVGNCGNIYSFGSGVETSVITLPNSVTAKNIILPLNGYLVLQSGLTTFSEPSCPPRESIWKRHGPLDWFDPSNWKNDDEDATTVQNGAIAHVERVPCQFDSVKFKANSSFSIFISGDVSIRKFIVGNETLVYPDVAMLMSTSLGIVQFKKKPETKFQVLDMACDESSNDCFCDNYQESAKRRICSLVTCPPDADEHCPYLLLPHGFCCPICGIAIKITHKDGFLLATVRSKLKTEMQSITEPVDDYVSRYKEGMSQIVLVPRMADRTADLGGLVKRLKAYLTADPDVTDVSIKKSWDTLNDASGTTSSELKGGAVGGIGIFFIILLIVICATLFTLYWKKIGIPSVSSSSCPPCPPCPTFPSVRMPSQFLSSTRSSSSFAFARFSNERISHLNLGPSFEGSSISRAETVDDVVNAARKSSVAPEVVTAELIAVGETENDNLARAKDLAQDAQAISEETEHLYDLIEIPETSAVLSPSSSATASSSVNVQKSEE